MNKKDIAHFRRQLKPNNELLKIADILNVYIMKESNEIYHYESQPFAMLDPDQQELYYHNFKKLLSGTMDEKLFELKFQHRAEDSAQLILHNGLKLSHVDDWREQMLLIVENMLQGEPFPKDTLITFIRGEYFKPTKQRNEEAEESEWDEVFTHPFILCTLNKTEQPQKSLMFDYVEREFKYNVVVDPIIKLSAPEKGFLFPSFTDGAADVNRILYASGKANQLDEFFIEQVLHCERARTAEEERYLFEEIVKEVAGEQLDSSTLANVYEEINRVIDEHEEEEPPTLDYKDVERVLMVSGVEDVHAEKVERAFKNVTDDQHYELKASSIVPKYTSKSIKIDTKVASISVSPQDLKYIKKVNVKGKSCLLIELDEDPVIEGFTLSTEAL